jgi:hypothetical protein
VDVSAQAGVVGKVVTGVIGVFVKDDLIASPIPATHVNDIGGGNAEKEAVKPEAAGSASGESPNVTGAEAACEATVLPGPVHPVADVRTAGVMANPSIARIHVRSVGMAGLKVEMADLLAGRRSLMGSGFRTPGWGSLRGCVAHRCGSALRHLGMVLGMALCLAPLIVSSIVSPILGECKRAT